MNEFKEWWGRLWAVLILLAAAQLIRAVVDGVRLIQAIRLHGWGG